MSGSSEMESLPLYVSIVFILTTFASVAVMVLAAKEAGIRTRASSILLLILPFWVVIQAVLGLSGFFLQTSAMPPRIGLFAVIPPLLLIAAFFLFFRAKFVERLPLKLLTLLHVVRIPVEIVLFWLAAGKVVPEIMTFEGRNFDILSGILAIVVYFVAFRGGGYHRPLLIGFNLIGLALLSNIVVIALLSFPTPLQQMSFDQPNVALLHFPFNWLPSVIVPIVLFCHLASLWQLFVTRKS